MLVDFTAHQQPPLRRTLDSSRQRRVSIQTASHSSGHVLTPNCTWLGAQPANFTIGCQPCAALGQGLGCTDQVIGCQRDPVQGAHDTLGRWTAVAGVG